MNILKTFHLPEDGEVGFQKTRQACRGIVVDENNLLPLIFVGKDNYHKLPGGGIEGNEEKIDAFKREILEETGYEINSIQEIGTVIEENSTRKQTSYCYIGKIAKKGNKKLTPEEIDKGYIVKWVTLQEALFFIKNDLPISLSAQLRQQRDLYILQQIQKILVH